MITSLKPNQVFVFGSNDAGFHGAGAAGFACRGDAKNTWRQDHWFNKALNAPLNSPIRQGKWAVVGRARGLQIGREGKSYAIVTITRPGYKRSTPLVSIRDDIIELFYFASLSPFYEFLMTPIGAGLAGYVNSEMADTFHKAIKKHGKLPPNITLEAGDFLYDVKWNNHR